MIRNGPREQLTNIASTFTHQVRRLSRVTLLPLFALSLLAAMWIAVLHQLGKERSAARNEAVVQSQSLARVLSEQVRFILRQTDHATQLFKLKYEETGGAVRLPEFTRKGGLLDSVLPSRLELPIAIIDRHGAVVDSAHAFLRHKVADQPYFRTLAEGTADRPLYSTPLLDPRTGKWQIQVARRLNDRDGQFAGLIVIMIDPSFFIDDYDRLNLDDQSVLLLMSRNGGMSIGRVGERMFIRDDIAFAARADGAGPSGGLVPSKPLDQVRRIYSAIDLPQFSLVAVVGITDEMAMATFERHRTMYLWITLAATAVISAITGMLMRQSARLRASMCAAREAQAVLRAAADGSPDGFMVFKALRGRHRKIEDFIIADINANGAAMLKRPRAELLGQPAFALLPKLRQTGFFTRYVEVMERRQTLDEEVEIHLEGEAPRWIQHQIVPIDEGVAITSRDITMRKHAEFELRGNRGFLQSLIDNVPLLISVKSLRPASYGTMVVWNKAAETVTGYSADEVVGRVDGDAFPDGFALRNAADDRAMGANPMVVDKPSLPLLRPDGALRCVHAVSVPLFDEDGKPEYILCIAEDITRRQRQEQELRTSEAQLAAVTNASPLGLVRVDIYGNCTYANRMFETITGQPRTQSLGTGWLDGLHPEDRGFLPEVFQHQRNNLEPYKKIVRCPHADGQLVWAALKVAAVRIDGRIEGYVGSMDDITTLREAEMALRESEARLRTIADTLPAMVAYVDAAQVYRFHNLAYDREFGREGWEVPGMTVRETVGEKRYAVLEPYIARALRGETLIFEEQDESEGVERALEVTYIPQLGDDGVSVVGFHVMRQDITSQKREKKRLLKLAQVDALTGLTNRAGFLQKLSAAMHESVEEGQLMAVMYMDIDRFKPVNDTHGHNVGDALLKAFSARLTHTLRASDTIARLGGDEFTIIMENIARPEDAAAIAAKIVSAMQAPFELGEVTVSVSASIGLTYFRGGAIDPDALLKQADMLLYKAKQAGRNTYRSAESDIVNA